MRATERISLKLAALPCDLSCAVSRSACASILLLRTLTTHLLFPDSRGVPAVVRSMRVRSVLFTSVIHTRMYNTLDNFMPRHAISVRTIRNIRKRKALHVIGQGTLLSSISFPDHSNLQESRTDCFPPCFPYSR